MARGGNFLLCRRAVDRAFLGSLASIVLIDLLLAGDNAVVIAMAVRPLPPARRRAGIALGAGAAVALRVALTFFVARLLAAQLVKLAGGALMLWIAAKLFREEAEEAAPGRAARSTFEAAKLIAVADATMSLDNMLAVGGASGGDLKLLAFGLCLSIPCVVFTSDLLARLMDRHRWIVFAGAAVLGRVAGEMIMTDPLTARRLHPTPATVHAVEAALAVAVTLAGWLRTRAARRATISA